MLFKELTDQAKLATSHYQDSNHSELYEALNEMNSWINQESLKHPLELHLLLNIELSELSYVQNTLIKSALLVNLVSQFFGLNFLSRQTLVSTTCLLMLEISQHGKYLSTLAGIELVDKNIEKFAQKSVKRHKSNKSINIDVMSILFLVADLKSNKWQLKLEQDIVKLCIHLICSSYGTGKSTRLPLYQRLAQYNQTTSDLDIQKLSSKLHQLLHCGLVMIDGSNDYTSLLVLADNSTKSIPYNPQQQCWSEAVIEQSINEIKYVRSNCRLSLSCLSNISQLREQYTFPITTESFSQLDNRVFPVNGQLNALLALLENDRQDRLFPQVGDASEIGVLLRETVAMLMASPKNISSVKHAYAIAGATNFTNVFISSSLLAAFKENKHMGQVSLEGILELSTKINLHFVKLLKQDKALELNLVVTVLLLSLITVPKVRFAMVTHKYQEIGTLHQFFAETDLSKLKQLSLNIAKRWGCSAAVLFKLQNFYRCNESASYKIKLSMAEEKAVNQIELALSLLFDFLSGQSEPHFFHLSQLIELDVPQDVNPEAFYQTLISKVKPTCQLV